MISSNEWEVPSITPDYHHRAIYLKPTTTTSTACAEKISPNDTNKQTFRFSSILCLYINTIFKNTFENSRIDVKSNSTKQQTQLHMMELVQTCMLYAQKSIVFCFSRAKSNFYSQIFEKRPNACRNTDKLTCFVYF